MFAGGHGYDPLKYDSMHPIFLAMGPAFKKKYSFTNSLPNVNIYPLMCHILDLTPAPNNGSLENVRHMLAEEPKKESDGFTITEVSSMFCIASKQ